MAIDYYRNATKKIEIPSVKSVQKNFEQLESRSELMRLINKLEALTSNPFSNNNAYALPTLSM